jgi:hypothetical protein
MGLACRISALLSNHLDNFNDLKGRCAGTVTHPAAFAAAPGEA